MIAQSYIAMLKFSFSASKAAQEMLMSICLSVCLSVSNRTFFKLINHDWFISLTWLVDAVTIFINALLKVTIKFDAYLVDL